MLCTSIYGVEIVTTTHNFQAMSPDKTQIEFSNSNKVAKTELLTYTCNDKAKFGPYEEFSPSPICILMSETGATVTTTLIDNLRRLVIHYYYEGKENLLLPLELLRIFELDLQAVFGIQVARTHKAEREGILLRLGNVLLTCGLGTCSCLLLAATLGLILLGFDLLPRES